MFRIKKQSLTKQQMMRLVLPTTTTSPNLSMGISVNSATATTLPRCETRVNVWATSHRPSTRCRINQCVGSFPWTTTRALISPVISNRPRFSRTRPMMLIMGKRWRTNPANLCNRFPLIIIIITTIDGNRTADNRRQMENPNRHQQEHQHYLTIRLHRNNSAALRTIYSPAPPLGMATWRALSPPPLNHHPFR